VPSEEGFGGMAIWSHTNQCRSRGPGGSHGGGGGNRTLPSLLEPSGTVGSTHKVSQAFWSRGETFEPAVDTVNTPRQS
jgi:hypothetical protein